MSPVNHHITSQLRHIIYYSLDCSLFKNALFLASRLHAYEPRSSEAAYLLALCFLRLGQLKAAYDHSKSSGSRGTHLGCSYVFAQACLGLERYQEGMTALERSRGLWAARNNWNKHTESRRHHHPDAAAVLCLMGKLSQAYEDFHKCIECYAESLRLNPFIWDAFAGLCDLGVNLRIPNIFKMTPEMMSCLAAGSSEETFPGQDDNFYHNSFMKHSNSSQTSLPKDDPFSISTNRINTDGRSQQGKPGLFEKLNGSTSNLVSSTQVTGDEFDEFDTPLSGQGGVAIAPVTRAREVSVAPIEAWTVEPPPAPVRKPKVIAGLGVDLGLDAPPKMRSSRLKSKTSQSHDSEELDVTSRLPPSLGPGITDRKRTVSGQAAPTMAGHRSVSQTANDPPAGQRKSARLMSSLRPSSNKNATNTATVPPKEEREIKKARSTIGKGRANPSTVGRIVSGNRKHADPMDVEAKESQPHVQPRSNSVMSMAQAAPSKSTTGSSVQHERAREQEGLQALLDLFTKMGSSYFALSHYQTSDALQILSSIPATQRDTPYIQSLIGRALFEQGSYSDAEKHFSRIRTMSPSTHVDMEIYSTILWHLKSEIDLSFLAHELLDSDRLSPQAWCAVGNSFSLQRDHDQALKCFKRATQLDPRFAYAHTLQGHEHISNEEFDRAMSAYRRAIAADSRHYNAWYGLGRVFEKKGKYDHAEQHYRTAAAINPTNAVLICCIGVVLEKLKRPQAALEQYARSVELQPQSALSRFKKARVLMALQAPEEALAELEYLKGLAPDEANVHFLLGRCYKVLGRKGDAIRAFTTALNLDPKASHHIKNAMEQMELEDEDDGVMQ